MERIRRRLIVSAAAIAATGALEACGTPLPALEVKPEATLQPGDKRWLSYVSQPNEWGATKEEWKLTHTYEDFPVDTRKQPVVLFNDRNYQLLKVTPHAAGPSEFEGQISALKLK